VVNCTVAVVLSCCRAVVLSCCRAVVVLLHSRQLKNIAALPYSSLATGLQKVNKLNG
jgi:hypothetical protein